VTGQGRYLFDTNVLSETWKPKANQGVIEFLRSTEPTSAFISVLTIGELRKGSPPRSSEIVIPTRRRDWLRGWKASS